MKGLLLLILTIVLCISFFLFVDDFQHLMIIKEFDQIISLGSVLMSALAFMWLIFGYHQQSQELKLQRNELMHQVSNTAKLVEQAELQATANIELIEVEKNRIKEDHIHRIRPVLVFSNTGTNEQGANVWLVKNVGNSSAINIIISCTNKFEDWDKDEAVIFSAMAQNDFVNLFWITKHGALVAIYSDIEENTYTTTCFRNKNIIKRGNHYPDLSPKKAEWQVKKEFRATRGG